MARHSPNWCRIGEAALCILCLPLLAPLFCFCTVTYRRRGGGRSPFPMHPAKPYTQQEKDELDRRKGERNAQPTLPVVRPRALSLPLPLEDTSAEEKPRKDLERKKNTVRVTQITHDQAESSILYTLPLEIRTMIWEYAITGHHIHIARRRGRLGHAVCPHPDDIFERGAKEHLCLERRDGNDFWLPTNYPPRVSPLSLLKTCRQIYSETIDLLYTGNTFAFADPPAFDWFHTSVLPSRTRLLRSIEIPWEYQANVSGSDWNVPPIPMWRTEKQHKMFGHLCYHSQHQLRHLRFLISTSWSWNRLPSQFNSQPSIEQAVFHAKIQNGNPIQVVMPWHSFRLPTAEETASLAARGVSLEIHRALKDRNDFAAFAVPFNARCLHCGDGALIPAGARTTAERCFFDIEGAGEGQEEFFERSEFYRVRHGPCGGLIEFETELLSTTWRVTHGAERLE